MTQLKYVVGLLMLMAAQCASAAPVPVHDSGFVGDIATVGFGDPHIGASNTFEGAFFYAFFDSTYLTFRSASASSTVDLAPLESLVVPGELDIGVFVLTAITVPISSIISLDFDIIGRPPGPDPFVTPVRFVCLPTNQNDPTVCSDYQFTAFDANVTINNRIPIPGTLWLMALGLTALAVGRKRA